MNKLYRITTPNNEPRHFAGLLGAADMWREAGGNAVVEQVTASDKVIRRVPDDELRRQLQR